MTDEAPKKGPHGGRPRGQHIKVWVNNDEKAELADRAAQAGLSLSAYMKVAGLNAPIRARSDLSAVTDLVRVNGDLGGTVAKLAMRQPFVLFKGLTFQKLCLPGAFRPGDHHNKMLRPGLCVVHASPQYL